MSSGYSSVVDALLSVEESYSTGIPIAMIDSLETEAPVIPEQTSAPKLIVVVSAQEIAAAELLQLLQRIVEKGLEISWSEVQVVSPGDSTSVTEFSIPIIVFGVSDHEQWTKNVPVTRILPTVSLAAIHADASVKRQFWLRLQNFRGAVTHA